MIHIARHLVPDPKCLETCLIFKITVLFWFLSLLIAKLATIYDPDQTNRPSTEDTYIVTLFKGPILFLLLECFIFGKLDDGSVNYIFPTGVSQ